MFFLIAVILTWFFQLFPQDKPPEQDRWIQEYEPFYNYLEVEQNRISTLHGNENLIYSCLQSIFSPSDDK